VLCGLTNLTLGWCVVPVQSAFAAYSNKFSCRGFGCEVSFSFYFTFFSAIPSMTSFICKSLCIFSFRRYHGAPVMILRILDCARCTMSMLLLDALPHSMGFKTKLYKRTLYSRVDPLLLVWGAPSWPLVQMNT